MYCSNSRLCLLATHLVDLCIQMLLNHCLIDIVHSVHVTIVLLVPLFAGGGGGGGEVDSQAATLTCKPTHAIT